MFAEGKFVLRTLSTMFVREFNLGQLKDIYFFKYQKT